MTSEPYTDFRSIIINGQLFSEAEIKKHLRKNDFRSDFEKRIFKFIRLWLNGNEYVPANTSGSTGKPKTIRLEKQQMVHSAKATGQYFNLQKGQKALLCLPVEYIAGKMMIIRAIVLGLDLIVVEPTSNPLEHLETEIDFAAMVPLQVENAIRTGLDKIRQLIIGGAPLSNMLEDEILQSSVKCYATYGMTETITHIAIRPLNGDNRQPYFQALDNVRFKQDERACLIVHAPLVTPTDVVTNDVIELISDTSFIWKGRFDNVINTGGVKVFPETIETKIESIVGVPFFIASIPHDELGEQVVLIIEGIPQNHKRLKEDLTSVLSQFETPKKIFFLPEFPRTNSGKIKRKATVDLLP